MIIEFGISILPLYQFSQRSEGETDFLARLYVTMKSLLHAIAINVNLKGNCHSFIIDFRLPGS